MNDFSKKIVDEIETRGIAPIPRWHFLLRRSVFWSLAILSVGVGAIAFSIADYIFFDNEGAAAAKLLESPLEWVIQTIPLLWIILFGLFAASTYVSLRHTRSGYRYRAGGIAAAALVATIGLGLVLNALDFGQTAHYYLLNHTGYYDALVHSRDDLSD